ncbi:MAG: hypothetical protein JWR01_2199 [Subtercola sp.]|nr:hypothetical protein [Subtercola sp.]
MTDLTVPRPDVDLRVDQAPAEGAIAPATPYRRLVGGLVSAYAGALVVQAVPTNLLLATHLSSIAGPGATAAFGLVSGLGGLATIIANPLGGRLSDRTTARLGRRRTWILTGGLGASLTILAMIFTTAVWQVVVVWCIVQLLVTFQLAAAAAVAPDQLPAPRRGSVSGLIGLISALAPVVGLAAVTLAAGTPALQWMILAGMGIVAAIVSVLLLRDPQHGTRGARRPLDLRELASSYWVNPRRHPAFGWAWLVRFLLTCTVASIAFNTFLLIDRFHMDNAEVNGTVLGLSLLAIVVLGVTTAVSGVLSDRLRRQKPFLIGGGLVAAGGLVIMAFAPAVATVFLGVGVIGLGYGAVISTDFALCIRVLPDPEAVGKDFAVLNIASSLPGSIVPFAAPLLIGVGGFPAFYFTLALLAVIGALLVLRLPEIGREGDPRWALITRP